MKGLEAEIAMKGYKLLKAKIEPRVQRLLQRETQKMLMEFDNHPVTKEIEKGPTSSNSSGTLGGYGNLFSFIGFSSGDDPISPIRSLLARSIKIVGLRKKRGKLLLGLKFTVPTDAEIAAVSPSPWSTDSWVEAVERGMTGLGRYLYSANQGRFATSRSGTGIEASVEIRGSGSSTPTEYTSVILRDMLASIENALKTL